MIRLIQKSDAKEIWGLVDSNRKYLKEWLPWLDWNTTIEDTVKFVARSMEEYARGISMVHVIVNERICGLCAYHSINKSLRAGYIGYWLAENCQGRGLVTDAVQELERIGFEELNLNKIEIHVAVQNFKSRAVAERLGYIKTGVLLDAELLYGKYVDHVVYCKRKTAKQALHSMPR